jgi:hypothetical protein
MEINATRSVLGHISPHHSTISNEPSTPPPHNRATHRYITRDECLQVHTLHLAGHTQSFIANFLEIFKHQVSYALARKSFTPKKRSGRPPRLSRAQVDELEAYVTSSDAARSMSYLRLAQGPCSHWVVNQYTLRSALRSREYSRRVARAKPLPTKS